MKRKYFLWNRRGKQRAWWKLYRVILSVGLHSIKVFYFTICQNPLYFRFLCRRNRICIHTLERSATFTFSENRSAINGVYYWQFALESWAGGIFEVWANSLRGQIWYRKDAPLSSLLCDDVPLDQYLRCKCLFVLSNSVFIYGLRGAITGRKMGFFGVSRKIRWKEQDYSITFVNNVIEGNSPLFPRRSAS